MFLAYSSKFKKSFKKLSKKDRDSFMKRLNTFLEDEYNPILNNHKLHGEYSEYRSINISSDIRVIYRKINRDACLFYAIGSHSELYS